MWFSLILLLLPLVVDARVTFEKSEVLDNVDLKGTNKAPFRCSAGCRVFSPNAIDYIFIVDEYGNKIVMGADGTPEILSLHMISKMYGWGYEIKGGSYMLVNEGPSDPSFVFYAVERGAANFNASFLYLNSDEPSLTLYNEYTDGPITILSLTGLLRFANFTGFTDDYLPSIYASGFDSIDSCRPVFTPNSADTLGSTSFTVNSPIATIILKKSGMGKVLIYNDYKQSSMEMGRSAVYVSPGYVGCPSVIDSLYTLVSPIACITPFRYLSDTNGLSVAINGDYSIANQADALILTVNNEAMKLYGYNTISKWYDGTAFDIALNWEKKEGSKDGFAIQIDIGKKGELNPAQAP